MPKNTSVQSKITVSSTSRETNLPSAKYRLANKRAKVKAGDQGEGMGQTLREFCALLRGPKTMVAWWHCYSESFCASGKFLRVTLEIALGSFRTV